MFLKLIANKELLQDVHKLVLWTLWWINCAYDEAGGVPAINLAYDYHGWALALTSIDSMTVLWSSRSGDLTDRLND